MGLLALGFYPILLAGLLLILALAFWPRTVRVAKEVEAIATDKEHPKRPLAKMFTIVAIGMVVAIGLYLAVRAVFFSPPTSARTFGGTATLLPARSRVMSESGYSFRRPSDYN